MSIIKDFFRALHELPTVVRELRATISDVEKAKHLQIGLDKIQKLQVDLSEEIRRTRVAGDHYRERVNKIEHIESVELWKRIKPIAEKFRPTLTNQSQ